MTEPRFPAGWYPDVTTPGQLRWWDGTQWTSATQAATGASGPSLPGDLTWGQPPRKRRTWLIVSGVLGGVVVLIAGLAILGAAVGTDANPRPSGSPRPLANFDANSFPTCSSLVQDIKKLASQDRPHSLTTLDIYRPKMVRSHLREYLAGTYKIPAGQVKVVLLTCKGTALLANDVTLPIDYEVYVDVNGNLGESVLDYP